jgi:hypothetical protein
MVGKKGPTEEQAHMKVQILCKGICTTKDKIYSTSNFTTFFVALFTKDHIMIYKLVQVRMFVCTGGAQYRVTA